MPGAMPETRKESGPLVTKLEGAVLLCGIVQIFGLGVVLFADAFGGAAPVLIGISGFAAITAYFLPLSSQQPWLARLRAAAAVCGLGLIAFAVAL